MPCRKAGSTNRIDRVVEEQLRRLVRPGAKAVADAELDFGTSIVPRIVRNQMVDRDLREARPEIRHAWDEPDGREGVGAGDRHVLRWITPLYSAHDLGGPRKAAREDAVEILPRRGQRNPDTGAAHEKRQ